MDSFAKRLGIVTKPIGPAGQTPLINLLRIMRESGNPIYLLSGNASVEIRPHVTDLIIIPLRFRTKNNLLLRGIRYLCLQLNLSRKIMCNRHNIDFFLFFLDAHTLVLPLLAAKLMGKKVGILLAASIKNTSDSQNDPFANIILLQEKISFRLANRIILYSGLLKWQWNMERFAGKILIAHEHFLDFNTFTVTTPYSERSRFIGYIGRLSAEKGVQNFTEALSAILSNHLDLRVLIGGDGQLKETIEKSLQEQGIRSNVDLPGWISHDGLPKYLNQLRLLVLPSYTEGLPNIMLEAMACGTPVLATPVGAIPDVIQDEVTGFIMENNTPECIARSVMRALNHPDLEGIAERGRQYVEKEFTFEKAVERWQEILNVT